MNVHTPELAGNQRLTEVVKAARAAGVALTDIRAITDPLPQLRDRTIAQIEDAIAKVQALHDPDAALLAVNDAAPEVQPALSDMLGTAEPKEKSPLHLAALDYIAKGYRVIPIAPGAKTPMLKGWHENALETREQVDEFWSRNPECNIAMCPEDLGLAIVEQDPGGDVTPLNLPATFEIESPRGGTHYYYVGSVPPSASKLAPHVDTRGRGSYVLIPPSVVNGKTYRVKAERPVAALPAEIEAKLAPRAEVGTSNVHDLDLPTNVARARQRLRDLVASGRVAIEGRGGDNFTYQVGCELVRDLALSVDKALELMLSDFNPHCIPPWPQDELRAKLEHVAEYGQNQEGTYAVAPASEVFKDAPLAKVKAEPTLGDDVTPRKRVRFHPVNLLTLADSPAPTYWDAGGLLVRATEGAVTVLYGRKGINKTGFMLSATVNLVLTNPDARVVYFAGEAPDDLARSRIPPVCEHFGKTLADLVETGRFGLIDKVPQLLELEQVTDAIEDLGAMRPNIVVIDTVTRALFGRNLNHTEVMTAAYAAAEHIRQTFKALVVLIHHEGKDESKGAKGDSSLEQNADIVLHATSPAKGMTRIHLKHSRYGRDGGEVFFRSVLYSKEGRYKDVPVLEQSASNEALEVFDTERAGERTFHSQVVAVLRENGSHDPYKTGMLTADLARVLVNLSWHHVKFPSEAQQREWNTAHKKMIEQLDNGARTRKSKSGGTINGVLTTLCERVAQSNSHNAKLVRMWYVPRLLADTPDSEE